MTRWLLATLLAVPLVAASQDTETLLSSLEGLPGVRTSGPRAGPEDMGPVLGADLGVAEDYGVVAVSEVDIALPGGEVSVRVLEMSDSAAAFGFFAYRRDWRANTYQPATIGADGYSLDDRVVFWQSQFVIEIRPSNAASLAAGRLISDRITGPSRKPTVSTLLPATGRLPDSERYILTPSLLREWSGLDPDLLGFEDDVEVATASYRDARGSATLALLSYPTPQLARLHAARWLETSGSRLPSRLSGLLFGIVTSADSADLTESILSELRSEFDVSLVPPPPDVLTIQEIVLTAFTWIGLALLFTVVVGLGFGGLRIYMKTRYPDRFYGGDAGGQFLQLNIDQPVKRIRPPE
jgi:hypothetical protein